MDHLQDKVAVITGAASGIGFALAEACIAERMQAVLVDLPGERLDAACAKLRQLDDRVTARGLDVSDAAALRALAAEVQSSLGGVHLLCNNAGISGIQRLCWNFTDADWQRMLDVNLHGVINGLQAFVPLMLAQDEGHIVNTASMAGLIPTPMNAAYCASKFAVVGISEVLSLDLQQVGSKLGVSVLCPGLVKTAIGDNRNPGSLEKLDAAEREYNASVVANMEFAMEPAQVAQLVLTAVRDRRFYVLTHPEAMPLVENRLRAIVSGGEPTFRA